MSMTSRDLKIPEDPTKVRDIVERIKRVQAQNNPKGLPKMQRNTDETDSAFPLKHCMPRDVSWMQSKMITGNGYGPELGEVWMP